MSIGTAKRESARSRVSMAWWSVSGNAALGTLQIFFGLRAGALSLLALAAHSALDTFAAGLVLFATREAVKPPDEDHPYGHGKIENLSATGEALLIVLTAGGLATEACRRFWVPQPLGDLKWAFGAALFSTLISLVLAKGLLRAGREEDSRALEASGAHWSADAWVCGAVAAGLAVLWAAQGRGAAGAWLWLDPATALALSLFLAVMGGRVAFRSGRELLDERLPKEESDWIRARLSGLKAPVRGYHDLRCRKSGSNRFVEFHLLMDPDLTVKRSHDINDRIERAIGRGLQNCQVQIHVEPAPRRGPKKRREHAQLA
ncbi:MAG TPA: cation diffusion facilitator family transporter [bacterium]|jgi:cation diffusion facilitator family transporter|nr:cation diffusion facilitator family transporter [bacterium]